MRRRDFLLGSALGVLVAPRLARGIGPGQDVRLMQLMHDGRADPHPRALSFLAEELSLRTSIVTARAPTRIRASDARLTDSLFLLCAGTGSFRFSDEERGRLARWLGLGGFLVFDNSGFAAPDPDFDASARRELARIMPGHALERVSPEHVIYRSFYRLDYAAGRAIHRPYIEGIRLGSRICAVIVSNDLLGALETDEAGGFRHLPTPGGERQREMALRFGVNLVLYATCLHYKDDQVHVDYLLHKRTWKITRPQ